jgi:hypothetical protein
VLKSITLTEPEDAQVIILRRDTNDTIHHGTKRGPGLMAGRMRKNDKKWMWVAKPGDKIVVSRTAFLPSKQLSRREFRALEEIVNIYTRMLGDVLSYASRNIIEKYYRESSYLEEWEVSRAKEYLSQYSIHYIHGLCQDAVERVSSLRRNRARQYSRGIFDELVKYLGLGKKDLRSRRIKRYL